MTYARASYELVLVCRLERIVPQIRRGSFRKESKGKKVVMQSCGCLRFFVCLFTFGLLLSLPALADSQLYTNVPVRADNNGFLAVGSESLNTYPPIPIPEPSTVLDIFGSGALASVGLIFNGRLRQKLFGR
jgi:hypothetical protein